jgi:hypothetical protein
MTAEVAIMNTQGIALAADSAVTLGGAEKTFNTADKLFALSRYHPVGIMVYSSASIMGIEWETIIKSYRDFLGKKSFDTLSEYAGDFINYLAKFPYFTEEQQQDFLRFCCYADFLPEILNFFLRDLHKEFDEKENITEEQIDDVFEKTLKNIKTKLKGADDEKNIKLDVDFINANAEIINEAVKDVFENYEVSKKQTSEIIELIKLYLQKGLLDNYTGIVIAGYGEREIFPVIHEFCVCGKLGNSLIYFNEQVTKIEGLSTSSICPYSQTEMVHQFAKGIDPSFQDGILDKCNDISRALVPLLKEEDRKKPEKLLNLLNRYINAIIDASYKDPIMNIVSSMQKSELCSMAEAMVSLTALKRHVSPDSETVGGPIDVALITKGDGFIWIKKKTQYDPHLNRELSQSYFRGNQE